MFGTGPARTLIFMCVDRAYGKPKNANRRIFIKTKNFKTKECKPKNNYKNRRI
jgi:hypothetical protein